LSFFVLKVAIIIVQTATTKLNWEFRNESGIGSKISDGRLDHERISLGAFQHFG